MKGHGAYSTGESAQKVQESSSVMAPSESPKPFEKKLPSQGSDSQASGGLPIHDERRGRNRHCQDK